MEVYVVVYVVGTVVVVVMRTSTVVGKAYEIVVGTSNVVVVGIVVDTTKVVLYVVVLHSVVVTV
jgi:hypothetical protein